jgi:integrase
MNARNHQLLEAYRKSLGQPHPGFEAVAEAFLEKVGSREPTMADVLAWTRRKNRKSSTLLKEWRVLHRLFVVNGLRWDAKRGDAPAVNERDALTQRLDSDVVREMILIARERQASFSFAPTAAHKAFLALSTMWGLRRGEMARISPKSLDTKGSLIYVETEKHGPSRWHYVPPEVMVVLLGWGFDVQLSLDQASTLFVDWREMAGIKLPETIRRLGWHAIRGTLDYELQAAGLPVPDIARFMRWRRNASDMVARYGSMQVIGRSGTTRELSVDEKKADLKVMEVHPFLQSWIE